MSSPAPPLFTLLYVSALAPSAQLSDVADIAKKGRPRNQQDGISGLLVFDGCSFVQLVEGPQDAIAALLERLTLDTRHTDIDVLIFEHTGGERRFWGWDLGYHFADDEGYELALLRGLSSAEALAKFEAIQAQANTFAATAMPLQAS
ncbi:MAG: BLUF domain-containing protein [Burkholderiaceae bacterium]